MTTVIEIKGIEELRERLSKIDIDEHMAQVLSQTAAKLKEDMKKPVQRERPVLRKETGELRPSINPPFGIAATERVWFTIQQIEKNRGR